MTVTTPAKRLSALLLVAGLTFGAAACGSSDSSDEPTDTTEKTETTEKTDTTEDSGDEVSFDDWVDEVNAACVDLDDATSSIAQPDTEDADEVSEAIGEVSSAFDDFVATLEDAGTPDENADDAADYLDLAIETQEIVAEAAETAADDPEAALALMEDANDVGDEASALAEDLGLDECTSDDSTDTTDTTEDDTDATVSTGDGMDPTAYDAFVEGMVDQGLTEEEATCIADLLDADVADGVIDPNDTDSMDASLFTDYALECVSTERLAEIGANGGF